ncbi:MAG: hypothetical protein JST86_02655 [Bacteroidetes bacterium]|nr:hypothetical protein [Bacteroidota bacterium]
MKRRNFIIYTAVVAVGLPAAYYIKKHYWQPDPLMTPDMLAQFCTERELRSIGQMYIQQIPSENNKQVLTNLLLAADNNKPATTDKTALHDAITKKITEDFTADKTIILDGWFISITEARQCALLSLNQNQA